MGLASSSYFGNKINSSGIGLGQFLFLLFL